MSMMIFRIIPLIVIIALGIAGFVWKKLFCIWLSMDLYLMYAIYIFLQSDFVIMSV